jgi:hypothetical protein
MDWGAGMPYYTAERHRPSPRGRPSMADHALPDRHSRRYSIVTRECDEGSGRERAAVAPDPAARGLATG